ncbi:SDR family NAD(P)-dependent oxidoreductase [Synoicihabitans lomoniglobus]|uniref:SDR family NAD(P)-dependent oxidoreductase n=1 Tax=Synoicihabitans lomoniglobus TaxID=2909285 RepID=A0AAF0CPC9_9BACT|nr:SDR family oxidoreductase [Opitutaceae bacterium LMO-M01]WED64084.1 SDR family NAD(P)-dependent oxidoreductase [Opitutaceae bacterium LMO-M01]
MSKPTAQRITLITGAASGIGESTTRRFATEGDHIWAIDHDADKLRDLTSYVNDHGGRLTPVCLDLDDPLAIARFSEDFHRQHPAGADVLINNAGIGAVGTILQTEAADLDRLYRVNVRAPYQLSQLFLPAMVKRRRGAVINVASLGGLMGLRDRAAYCTTKFAVVGLTKSMALDHAVDQVRINCVCPARVETPFVTARIQEYPDPAEAYRQMSATQPIGRMARPEEIAAAMLYLASDDAAFITGSALVIDGGMSAGI